MLPDLVWQRGESVFLEDLAAAPGRFLRAEIAAGAGLLRGLALPVALRLADCHVVTFLANAQLPLAQGIERWVVDDSCTSLKRDYAFSEPHGGRSSAAAAFPVTVTVTVTVTAADSASSSSIARAWHRGISVISEQPAAEEGAPAAAAAAIGAAALLAIPVVWAGAVAEVVALYL